MKMIFDSCQIFWKTTSHTKYVLFFEIVKECITVYDNLHNSMKSTHALSLIHINYEHFKYIKLKCILKYFQAFRRLSRIIFNFNFYIYISNVNVKINFCSKLPPKT